MDSELGNSQRPVSLPSFSFSITFEYSGSRGGAIRAVQKQKHLVVESWCCVTCGCLPGSQKNDPVTPTPWTIDVLPSVMFETQLRSF